MEVRKYYTLIQKGFAIGPRKLQTSESIIRDSVTTHFKLNHLFSNEQFDFIKDRATSLQLLPILDQTVNDGVAHSHFTIPCYHISETVMIRPFGYDQEQF